jgi:hypothetical protein
MRLLKLDEHGTISLTEDLTSDIPPYAILSHTWGADKDEVTFEDMASEACKRKAGYAKLQFCGRQAKQDRLEHFWIDTCCINQTNSSELIEAITSMFRWYKNAVKCYVYLADVHFPPDDISAQPQMVWEEAYRQSRWFRRGWTLQELLAPKALEFFSKEGVLLGSREMLRGLVHAITAIPVAALQGTPLSHFPVDERFRWVAGRETKKIEDKAYCLLGIFDVSMTPRYGEGEKALQRLRNKVYKRSGK